MTSKNLAKVVGMGLCLASAVPSVSANSGLYVQSQSSTPSGSVGYMALLEESNHNSTQGFVSPNFTPGSEGSSFEVSIIPGTNAVPLNSGYTTLCTNKMLGNFNFELGVAGQLQSPEDNYLTFEFVNYSSNYLTTAKVNLQDEYIQALDLSSSNSVFGNTFNYYNLPSIQTNTLPLYANVLVNVAEKSSPNLEEFVSVGHTRNLKVDNLLPGETFHLESTTNLINPQWVTYTNLMDSQGWSNNRTNAYVPVTQSNFGTTNNSTTITNLPAFDKSKRSYFYRVKIE